MNNTDETTIIEESPSLQEETPVVLTDGDIYKIPVKQQLLLLGIILLLIFGTTITPHVTALLHNNNKSITPASLPNSEKNEPNDIKTTSDVEPFSDVRLNAKAAFVFDVTEGEVLFAQNENEILPLASITKLMTALVADEVLNKTDEVTIDSLSIKQDGDSGLTEGEVFDRITLSNLVLMSSSNDGAFALAATAGDSILPNKGANAFVAAMNLRGEEIGLKNTTFRNPTGLDITDNQSGADGTAKDVALLMEYILKNNRDILAYTKESDAQMQSQTGEIHDAQNTNYYSDNIPGLIGSKTGYTYLAGGNLVVAFNVGLERPIVAVVLGSTQQGRFTDMIELVDQTQLYMAELSE